MYKITRTAMSAVAAVLLTAACSRETPQTQPEGVNAKGATAAPVPKKPEAGTPAAPADPLKEGY